MMLYSTEPCIHVSADANDEDKYQQAKRRDIPVRSLHRGLRVGEDMRMEEKTNYIGSELPSKFVINLFNY